MSKHPARHRATEPVTLVSRSGDRPQHRASLVLPALTTTLLAAAVLLALSVVVRGVIR